ncbi:hypothetical protein H7R52_01910 [Weissella confusa]|uniref:Pyrroline-5-carboxylate reductase dimerisation domain-containing protein n=1 Tax=Weissella confusa TaxID=1583 RepID=A0A923NGA6_WEICO|nr:hypothetical protein [Weissella confusa]
MIQAGVQAGINPETAERLAQQTVIGTARHMEEFKKDPMTLAHEVMTPGGSTAAGWQVLEVLIARTLPNVNVALKYGYTALAFDDTMDADIKGAIAALFLDFGRTDELPEEQFGAVSALAGSGPALLGLEAKQSALDVWAESDMVVLAMPPAQLTDVAKELQLGLMMKPGVIVASVLGGVSLAQLHAALGPNGGSLLISSRYDMIRSLQTR